MHGDGMGFMKCERLRNVCENKEAICKLMPDDGMGFMSCHDGGMVFMSCAI